jgi:hypothetical protein
MNVKLLVFIIVSIAETASFNAFCISPTGENFLEPRRCSNFYLNARKLRPSFDASKLTPFERTLAERLRNASRKKPTLEETLANAFPEERFFKSPRSLNAAQLLSLVDAVCVLDSELAKTVGEYEEAITLFQARQWIIDAHNRNPRVFDKIEFNETDSWLAFRVKTETKANL